MSCSVCARDWRSFVERRRSMSPSQRLALSPCVDRPGPAWASLGRPGPSRPSLPQPPALCRPSGKRWSGMFQLRVWRAAFPRAQTPPFAVGFGRLCCRLPQCLSRLVSSCPVLSCFVSSCFVVYSRLDRYVVCLCVWGGGVLACVCVCARTFACVEGRGEMCVCVCVCVCGFYSLCCCFSQSQSEMPWVAVLVIASIHKLSAQFTLYSENDGLISLVERYNTGYSLHGGATFSTVWCV